MTARPASHDQRRQRGTRLVGWRRSTASAASQYASPATTTGSQTETSNDQPSSSIGKARLGAPDRRAPRPGTAARRTGTTAATTLGRPRRTAVGAPTERRIRPYHRPVPTPSRRDVMGERSCQSRPPTGASVGSPASWSRSRRRSLLAACGAQPNDNPTGDTAAPGFFPGEVVTIAGHAGGGPLLADLPHRGR